MQPFVGLSFAYSKLFSSPENLNVVCFQGFGKAVDAVLREPGSAPNPLFIGEITGNFLLLARFALPTGANGPEKSVRSGAILCRV